MKIALAWALADILAEDGASSEFIVPGICAVGVSIAETPQGSWTGLVVETVDS